MTSPSAIANKRSPRSKWFVVLVTVSLTVLALVIGRNFIGGEKRVQQRTPHLYGVRDSAFERAMGLALGPSIVGGNQIVTLLNGDEIFPAMLQDIQSPGGRRGSHLFEMTKGGSYYRDLWLPCRSKSRRLAYGAA
jgi:hypothetical protein